MYFHQFLYLCFFFFSFFFFWISRSRGGIEEEKNERKLMLEEQDRERRLQHQSVYFTVVSMLNFQSLFLLMFEIASISVSYMLVSLPEEKSKCVSVSTKCFADFMDYIQSVRSQHGREAVESDESLYPPSFCTDARNSINEDEKGENVDSSEHEGMFFFFFSIF